MNDSLCLLLFPSLSFTFFLSFALSTFPHTLSVSIQLCHLQLLYFISPSLHFTNCSFPFSCRRFILHWFPDGEINTLNPSIKLHHLFRCGLMYIIISFVFQQVLSYLFFYIYTFSYTFFYFLFLDFTYSFCSCLFI